MSEWPIGASCKNIKPCRVLVVEDEALIALFIAEQLTDLGHKVLGPAFSLPEARRFATEADIDLCLLDLNLRGTFSGEVADVLNSRRIPFLILTGYDRPNWDYPDVEVLTKPIDILQLQRAIARAVRPSDSHQGKAVSLPAQSAMPHSGGGIH
jgi:CheY-like chemotaxis protein